ncbi:phage tail length tape measure family protein [Azospirillum sp. TSH58]|uniref:phage tail length tape measure family protein n=1 Tax=Azospirillum sp. TSH58 TaxID=664962 RepID=UPI001304808E|nr:phage tail length tape measure family protein [Azospirillum sp. TSH58]
MTDMRLARLTVDNGSVAEDLRKIQGLFDAVGGSVENTTKRLTGTSREFQAIARQAGVVTDAGAKIVRVFGEAKAAIDKGSVSAEDGARAMATLAKTVGITGQGLVEFVNTARASKASLEGLTEGTKEYREATAAHNRTLAEAIQRQQEKRREDEEAARKAQEATEATQRNARAVQALAEQMDSSTAAQNRFAAKQQEVIDLFVAGDLNGRQFARAMEHVSNSFDPAVIEARKLQVEYQNLLAKYDPVRAAVREHGQEVARATAILDKSNASEQVRTAVLKGIADAYDPATRAANERTAALKREEEAQAALMTSYREQAALARSSAEGQGTWNAYAGATTPKPKSAKDSADFFGPMLEKQALADEWESLIAMEGFAQQDRIAQTKAAVASNWEAQLTMDAWGAAEAKARLAAEWQGMLTVEEIKTAERMALTKAAVAERWEAQIAMEGFAAAEAKAKLAKDWEGMLAAEGFAQKERLAQLEHHAALVMQAELDMASFDAPAKFNRLVAGYDKESTDALKYANALGELRSTAAAAGVPLEQLAAAEEKLAAKMSPAALAAKRQADELAELRRTIDPMGERLRDLEAKKLKLDEAFAAGKLEGGRAEYEALSAAYEKHRLQLVRSTEAAEGFAGKIGLTRAQMTALAPQINDVVSGLMMGQPPMMIFVQQSGQIVQALQAGGAEFKLFSGSMGVALGVIAGVTVAMIALVAASESYRNSINAVNDANRIMGDSTGYSRGQLEDLAGSLDKVSTRSARQMETAFIRVGNVAGDQFRGAMGIVRDFARVTGQEVPEAAQKLADLLKDPAKGAETLRDSYRALTAAQAEYVQRLAAQGDVGKAQQIQLDALKAKYQDFADEGVGYLARAYHFLRTGVSDAWDWMGQIGAPKSLTKQLADAEAVVAKIEAKFRSTMGRAPVGNELRQIEPEAYGEVDTLRARKTAEEAVAAARAAGAAAEERRKAGLSLSKQLDTEIGQQNALNNQYRALEKSVEAYSQQIDTLSQGEGRAAAQLGQVKEAYAQVAEALDRVKNAKATHLSVSERLARQDQIALSYATQYGQLADRNRAREQADLETAGQKLTTKEREAKINSAVAQVIAQQTAAVTGQVVAARSAIVSLDLLTTAYGRNAASVRDAELAQKVIQATMGMAPDLARQVARAITEQELAQRRLNAATYAANLRDQVEDAQRLADAWTFGAAAVREAALANEVLAEARKRGLDAERDADTIRGIAEGVAARDMAQRAQTFGQMAEEQRQAVALANAEYAMLGQSNAARAQQVAMLQAANDLRAKGADLTDAGTRAYIEQAGELARVNSILQDAAQNAANIAQPISTAFEDVLVGAKQAGEAIEALGEDLKRIFVRQTITKPFETLVSGELTKLMAGPVAVANDNTPRAAADAGLLDRIVGKVNGGLGSTAHNAMWVRMASGAAALDATGLTARTLTGPVPVPVAVKDAGELEGVIQTASTKYGVDANLIKAVIQKESTWNPTAVNPRSGAAGLMQIMPANWSAYGVTNPFDPAQNVDAGTRIFREHLDRAGGDLERALSTFGGFITKSSDGYVASVKANKAAYDQAATSTVTLAGAQTQAAAAALVFTSEQRKVIDAALGSQKATAEATNQQDALTDGLGHFRESLEAEVNSRDQAVRATQQLTQAQQTAAAGMVGGTQAALGGIMSLVGGITGAGTVSVGGSVISAGGPQGIQSALGSLWNGISGGSFANTSLSGIKTWLNSTAWGGNVASKTAPVAKAGNGMLAGGEGAQTGMGTAPATPAVTWGNVVGGGLTAVGGAMQMSRAQNAGQSIGGAAQMASGVMMLIPGMQVAGGLVALGGTLLSAFSDGNSRGDPYSVTNLSMKGGRFTRGSFDADNGGDPAKWNSAVDQVAGKLNSLMDTYGLVAGKLTNVAVGERNATPEQAMLQALRSMKSDNADIAWVLANAVGDDLDAAVKAIDFAAKFRDTVALWNSGMDSIVAATQQGTAAANAFGKSVLAFLDGAAATYDVAALSAKAGGKTGNPALDKLLAGLPGYATGTPSAKSGWAVVGEEGPELVKLSGGERIWNARESARMVAGLGQGRDTELVHVRPDELAWMHKTLGGGRINPATGLPMFLEGETGGVSDTGSGGVGGMGGNSDGYGGHTDRDGGFTASENSGGIAGAISSISTAISNASRAIANALGLDAKEAGLLSGMVGLAPTAAIAAMRAAAEFAGKGLTAAFGPGDAPAVAGPGDPGKSPTGGDFAAAEAVLTKLLDAIKADPTGATGKDVLGAMEAGNTGYTVAQLGGGSSDAYLAGVRGQGGEAKVAALAEDLDAAVQSIAEAGVAIPDVLRQALEKTNAYATSLGITPATEKRETAARLLNEKLGEQGLSTGRYGEVMGVVQSLADGTFSAVGKDFQALADDMVKSMAAMSAAGMQVPAALAAAEKRMLALVAAKARIDAEIAGVTDTSTDYQKQVAQLTGYWSMASTDLVKAMQAVGYEGDVLTQKLGEGLKNALEKLNKETAKSFDTGLRSAQGRSYIDDLAGIREWWNKNATDMVLAGRNPNDLYAARAEKALEGLSVDQLNDVITTFRGVDDVMVGFAQHAREIALSKAMTDLDQRFKAAQVSLGQLSQEEYDRYELNLKHTDELADVTDAAVRARLLEVQAIEKQAKAEEALTKKREELLQTGGGVRSWLDQKNATAGTSVSPQEARDAAQAQFARDLALARGGDVEAYGRLTGAADRLLSSQEALTASGTETQTMRAWVMSSLENLPATKSYDQQMLEELRKLGGSVNVQVELTTVRVITEQLSALSDADKAKLTQAAVVLRTVEERIGRFLTDAELGRLVDNALVTRDVQQTLGRDLTDAERTALVDGGNVLRTVEQLMGRTLTAVEVESIVQSGSVSRSIEQAIGRNLTAAEAASIVEAGSVTRSIDQHLARDLSAPEIAALVVGGAVERLVTQQLGRDLTWEERAGLVTAATVIRSVEQQLGRPLTAAEQAAIILPGSVQRTIGQQIDPATGAVLVPGGTVTRTVTQSVETTETVQISRSIDDKMSGILASIKESSAGINTSAAGMQKLLERAVDGDGLMVRTRPTSDPRSWVAFERGGVVPGFENGGIVANGIPGRDSVVARGPGGMPIWLAGLEGILTASATAAIGGKPTIDYINQHHALPGWERVGYEAGGIAPPANDLWAPNVTPIRRQDYAPAPSRSGSDDRAVAELRLLRQAIERLERRLERNEGMDQEQRAAIAQEMARLLDRVADATETTAQKVSGRQG